MMINTAWEERKRIKEDMNIKVGLAQLSLPRGKPQENLEKVREWLGRTEVESLDLILLPELWASGYDLANSSRYASEVDQGIFREMKRLAAEKELLIGGSLLERDGDQVFNTFFLYGPQKEVYYRKIHLFGLLSEGDWLSAGQHLVMTEIRGIKTGLATCYDLRFPEMFRAYAVGGAELILLVAEWPRRRIQHWQKLLEARAIENQLFIAAVNKVGLNQDEILGGKSLMVDPFGNLLVQGGEEQELLTAELAMESVEKARRWIPVLSDRSPRAYRDLREF